MDRRAEIARLVEAKRSDCSRLSDHVWDLAEPAYAETGSAAAHADALRRAGFAVTEGVAGIPTAMVSEAGQGGPVVAFLGEYDALPGLSQVAGSAEREAVPGAACGHGCGHNLLGAGSLLAAQVCAEYLAAHGRPGRVRYYGCPAEEGGAGKVFMVRAGAFDGVDAAITWHPSAFWRVDTVGSLANMRVDFAFEGRAAHAAASPHLGRSALDGVELMSVGVNYLREHMPADARVHAAILDAGGIAPNVIPAHAEVRYLMRVRRLPDLADLVRRVVDIATGAALMTETRMSRTVLSAVADLLPNAPLAQAMHGHLRAMGPPPFDAGDQARARAFQAALSPGAIESACRGAGLEPVDDIALSTELRPLGAEDPGALASTDVGDVSWVVPTVQGRGATVAVGTPGHSWLFTAQGKTPAAHKAMAHMAAAMANTALDVLGDADLRAAARDDFDRRLRAAPYRSLLPDDAAPPIEMSDRASARPN